MRPEKVYPPLKWLSYLVLLLMAVAALYAFGISIANWSGISV